MLPPRSSAEKLSKSCPSREMQKLPLVWELLDQTLDVSAHCCGSLTLSAALTEIQDA